MSKGPAADIFQGIFLSEKDDGLLASGSRDPLGFEAIWVPAAHTIIPGLNTQSQGARNFAVVWLLHWLVDRWLENLEPTNRESYDLEVLRRHCLLVAESTYVLSVRAAYASNAYDVDLERLYGRDGAARLWNKYNFEAPIGVDSEYALLSGQFTNGHYGRYDAPLRAFDILEETLRPTDGTRVAKTDPIEHFAGKDWFQKIERQLRTWFDRILEEEAPTFELGNFRATTELTRLRDYETLAQVADYLCGPKGLEVEVESGLTARTTQGFLWQACDRANSTADRFRLAGETGEAAEKTEAGVALVRLQNLESFLTHVEALFDVCWLNGVSRPECQQTLKRLRASNKKPVERMEQILERRGAVTGASRLEQLLGAVDEPTSLEDFQHWLIERYHKPMMRKERNKRAWVTRDGDDLKTMSGSYSPPNNFHDDGLTLWRRRDYYLGTLASFREDVETARRRTSGSRDT